MTDEGKRGQYTTMEREVIRLGESEPAYDTTVWKRQGEYTLDDYYALPEDQRVELIDGVIYEMNAPWLVHQELVGMIFWQLADQLDQKGGPCKAYVSPVDITLGEDRKTIVEPDVFILCDPDKRRRWGIKGAPDFVLEILSPSTRRKDMTVKYNKYKSCGVREYWMLDIEKQRLIICDLENGREERILPLAGKEGLLIYQGEVRIDLDRIAEAIAGAAAMEER